MGLSTQDPNLGGGSGTPPVADTTLKRLSLTPDALTGSSALSSLSIAQTWNTTGAPTALDVNVTDTASDAASLLMNLRIGGSSVTNFDKKGGVSGTSGASQYWRIGPNASDPYVWSCSLNGVNLISVNNGGFLNAATFGVTGQTFASGSFGDLTLSGNKVNLGNADTVFSRAGAAIFQLGNNHATVATLQTIKAHNVTAGKGAGLDLVGGSSGNGANSGDVRMMAGTAEGVKVYHDETAGAAGIGFFGVGGTLRPTTSFSGVTFLPGMGTQVTEDATFGGYTLAQVVSALQALGLLS
jgi:hypothetical protein